MSTSFFIATYHPQNWEPTTSDLKIDPDDYKTALLAQWPDTIFYSPVTDGYIMHWQLTYSKTGVKSAEAGLQVGQQVIQTYYPSPDFVLWHREYIPENYPLFLFNSSSLNYLEITPDTTPDEIRKFIGLTD